jgi:ABC-2 type transport system ATP-binding protein
MEQAEKLCDDICLINRSQKILDGPLREVKQSFGRNSVALRVEGGNDVLEDKTLVAKIEQHSDEMEALLADGARAGTLRRLIAAKARITKFELVEPSLNDIFIEK